jgi:hypothetical protein
MKTQLEQRHDTLKKYIANHPSDMQAIDKLADIERAMIEVRKANPSPLYVKSPVKSLMGRPVLTVKAAVVRLPVTKHCSHCNQDLPLDQFYNNRRSKDGKQDVCKTGSMLYHLKIQAKKWNTIDGL